MYKKSSLCGLVLMLALKVTWDRTTGASYSIHESSESARAFFCGQPLPGAAAADWPCRQRLHRRPTAFDSFPTAEIFGRKTIGYVAGPTSAVKCHIGFIEGTSLHSVGYNAPVRPDAMGESGRL
jgi:hypothetical protein